MRPLPSDARTPTHAYPRPQLRRADWFPLDGDWEFSLDPQGEWGTPDEPPFERTIRVPFAPETAASGIHETGHYHACWYRRSFEAPELRDGERLILHFGAVDYAATVWVDDAVATRHDGGFTPFQADITDLVRGAGPHTIVVRADDDPTDLAKPRGKQDWQREPHSIWYHRTSGIWQTVWAERVPPTRIESLRWTPSLHRWELALEARLAGVRRRDLRLEVTLSVGKIRLAHDRYMVVDEEVHRRIALSDPGIDDFRNALLWSPPSPTLIEARIELRTEDGTVVDRVESYTALRSFAVQGDRVVLNGRPYPLRLVLDQGYWPETGMTAPDDDALRKDVELAKAMGFNGVRKHQKLEDPRYLYWADRLGLLVWGEMPSAYRFTRKSVERVAHEWMEALARDYSHPCLIAWVPFNESWGVPNLPDSASERHYVEALYHLTKTLDASRPVIGNDGWEAVATDIIGIHDYDDDPERIGRRYHAHEVRPRLFRRERPGGRVLVLDENGPHVDHPIVLSEFGGIRTRDGKDDGTWGYSTAATAQEFATRYEALLEVVRSLDIFAGFCYTQFADTWQEANGLLRADRTPKFPLERMAAATRGPTSFLTQQIDPLTSGSALALEDVGVELHPESDA